MNRLSNERRAQVLTLLTEGTGINAVVRITGIAKTTVLRLIAEAGSFSSVYQAYRLRALSCRRIEADEIWSFVGAKQKNATGEHQGDLWTYTCLDPDSKLMVAWTVGVREAATAHAVMAQLASRVRGRIQLTTDGNTEYLSAVRAAFGYRVDYAQLVKEFGPDDKPYTRKTRLIGDPRPHLISTSLVERANLTMRHRMRRFTRQSMGFSRKAANHVHAVDLNFMASNFVMPHRTLTERRGEPTTPAMAAGLERRVWSMLDVTRRMDETALIAAA